MKIQDILLTILIVAVVSIGGLALSQDTNVSLEVPSLEELGAQSGPEHYNDQYFYDGAYFEGEAHVTQSSSSTLQIGNTDSGVGTGCLVLGDSEGATSTPVYITASGATVSATTTQPDICK